MIEQFDNCVRLIIITSTSEKGELCKSIENWERVEYKILVMKFILRWKQNERNTIPYFNKIYWEVTVDKFFCCIEMYETVV
jgi:hypothetical protein